MDKIHPPLNVSAVSQAAALAELRDQPFHARVIAANRHEKEQYYRFFAQNGLTCLPTQTNFLMADLGRESQPVVDALLRRGVMIRPSSEYGMPSWVRISIGTAEENRLLRTHLADLLGLQGENEPLRRAT